MNTRIFTLGLGVLLAAGLLTARADAFDPAVQISNIQGDVTVKVPGSSKFVKAKDGHAYPYGTIVRTAEGATAVANLGNDNSCELAAESTVKFNVEGLDYNHVIMSILKGQADLKIAEGFGGSGEKLEVLWRGGYVLAFTGGEYTIETAVESELRVLALTVKSGQGSLAGPDYAVETLPPGSGLSIAGNSNLTFLRLRCLSGEFGVSVLDEELQPRTVILTEGRGIKIRRKVSATVHQ